MLDGEQYFSTVTYWSLDMVYPQACSAKESFYLEN